MSTEWMTLWCAQDIMRATNIPPVCWEYDSHGNPYGWRAAYPWVKGSKGFSGLARYCERVGRSCGSGMYFNAYREIATFSDQKTGSIGGEQEYLLKGKYYYLGNYYGSICVLDGVSIIFAMFPIEWSGNLVRPERGLWGSFHDATQCVFDEYHNPEASWFNCAKFSRVVGFPGGDACPYQSPESLVDWILSKFRAGAKSAQWVENFRDVRGGDPLPLPELDQNPNAFDWKDKEYWVFSWVRDVGVVLPPYGSMVSQAYTEAIASFPAVHSNVLANILDLISLAKSILSGNLGKVFKKGVPVEKAKDAWLAYRYSYTTSKLDYEELRAFVRRVNSLPTGEITLRSKISFHHTTVRCAVILPMSDIVGELGSFENLGLKLSATNTWDLIPFSFVADWFLRVSDWLDYFETQGFALTLHPKAVWYSVRTNYEGQTTYFRWPGVPAMGLPFDLYTAVSNKTALMRIGDSIALFT